MVGPTKKPVHGGSQPRKASHLTSGPGSLDLDIKSKNRIHGPEEAREGGPLRAGHSLPTVSMGHSHGQGQRGKVCWEAWTRPQSGTQIDESQLGRCQAV